MDLNQLLSGVSTDPRIRQLVIVAGAIVLALLVRMLFVRVITVFTRRTETNVDDRIARELRGPLVWTIILIGVMLAHLEFEAPTIIDYVVLGIIQTFIGLLWAVAMMRIGRVLLEIVSERVDKIKWIEPRTLPLFDMVLKVMVVGGFLYSVCLAWNVPLTSWLGHPVKSILRHLHRRRHPLQDRGFCRPRQHHPW